MIRATEVQPVPEVVAAELSRPTAFRHGWLQPHRIALLVIAAALVLWAALSLKWHWVPDYTGRIAEGIGVTLAMLAGSVILGFLMAVPLGLFQVTGPWPLAWASRGFCTLIRGTPILLQLWFIYYGIGSLFPQIDGIRETWIWPWLREAWPYGLVALTLSFAGYEGEVMRGAFAGVPRGELEAGRSFGMGRFKLLRRIWLPRALHRALPTLTGEMVLQLKATPLVATITVVDVFAVFSRVRQETYIIYEPLLLLAVIYLVLTAILVALCRYLERLVPARGA